MRTAYLGSKSRTNKLYSCVCVILHLVLKQMAAVAALCLQHEEHYRPEMSIVVKALSPLLSGGEVVNP